MGIRLTVDKLLEVLQENEGFRKTTSYDSRNLSFTRHYEIKDGKLFYTESGKGMMSTDRWEDDFHECDIDETRRFLHKYVL